MGLFVLSSLKSVWSMTTSLWGMASSHCPGMRQPSELLLAEE